MGGIQRNLTEENVGDLKKQLDKMQEGNPDLEYQFFKQKRSEGLKQEADEAAWKDEQPTNKAIFEKLEAMERKIALIFSNHVLINKQWEEWDTGQDSSAKCQ